MTKIYLKSPGDYVAFTSKERAQKECIAEFEVDLQPRDANDSVAIPLMMATDGYGSVFVSDHAEDVIDWASDRQSVVIRSIPLVVQR